MSKQTMIAGFIIIVSLLFTCTQSERISSLDGNQKENYTKNINVESREDSKPDFDTIRVKDYIREDSSSFWNEEIKKFYTENDYTLKWFEDRQLSKNASDLLESIKSAGKEGLSGNYYNVSGINTLVLKFKNAPEIINTTPELAVRLDLLLTSAYINYANDLMAGRFNPAELDVVWETYPQRKDLIYYLIAALEMNTIQKSLDKLKPERDGYEELVNAYNSLKKIKLNGGWPLPGFFPVLAEGDSGENVIKVKKYLMATSDILTADSTYAKSPVYDEKLIYAVEKFQERHGLEVDGVIGENTLIAMNRDIDYRLKQIRINLDRIRWMPEDLGERYIIVNIPAFQLQLIEGGRMKMEMKVIVGELENYTPILKDTISYLVFNPSWNVPFSIATEEMLPKIKKDPLYLPSHNYLLLKGSYEGDTINPEEVNWDEITKENFPYFIVQKPGKFNSLGMVKFMMPNNHAIYLHDTPADHLFGHAERDFSHGCVRLERPFELAEYLLRDQLNEKTVFDLLSEEEKKIIRLEKDITVHFIYHTAWVDNYGRLQFRKDLYNFDEKSFTLIDEEEKKEPVPINMISKKSTE